MKTDKTSGFTLVEVMIVVVIIGTIMTMALPSLHDRVIRTQITEGIQITRFVKDDVQKFYETTGRLPVDNQECGLPAPDVIVGNFVQSVTVENGTIHIVYGNKINAHAKGKTISIRPAIVKEEPRVPIAWVAGFSVEPLGMEAIENNLTDLEPRHLPVSARHIAIVDAD